jgi:ATP-dependent exoDNAse (exonuclease V) beta subunit
MAECADARERTEALDPRRSFIVQAPAGSGKTELLIQRFLVLLALCERPEKVVALTFTRKAASEMRTRIIEALARPEPAPDAAANEKRTWQLAQRVRDRDAEKRWGLAENPARLSVQTIDAFCTRLASYMPLSSGLGALPETVDDASLLYREAARETVQHMNHASRWSPAVEILLEHLDNDWPRVEELLLPMLARRDQWLRIGDQPDRRTCEAALARVIEEARAAVTAACPKNVVREIPALARYAAQQLQAAEKESAIRDCASLGSIEDATLAEWLGVAELLLRRTGDYRKATGVSARIGFPAWNPVKKKTMCHLLESLAVSTDFRERLHALRHLPSAAYSDDQWRALEALLEVLRLAAGELQMVFARRGQIDFIGIVGAAIMALGDESHPTDLALALDSRISHLLVDEFQDTSVTQHELIARLVAGWEPGDGRTLFLVGDPMQSIYRFRQAEVGLFLNARGRGIGRVRLHPLTLAVNFRSHSGLVNWVNATFAQVFPRCEDVGEGAVAFSPAVAHAQATGGVAVHPFFGRDYLPEAKKVAKIAAAARQAGQSVAILVRSRTHLSHIVPQLLQAKLRFKAVDIESLDDTQEVRDLAAIARAYQNLADRIAWLATLRAPWCGLMLRDLEIVARAKATIWDAIEDGEVVSRVSRDGAERLEKVRRVFAAAFAERGRRTLRRAVEGIWLALGGPACVRDETALANAMLYIERLPDVETDDVQPEELFAAPDARAGDELQVMTVHKAKGLEFDVVILPGLGRRIRESDSTLLKWAERPTINGVDLLIAPIPGMHGDDDASYKYLRDLEERREKFEEGRLLYVAATRAKHALHLLGNVALPANPAEAMRASGRLEMLWHAIGDEFACDRASPDAALSLPSPQRPLYRLSADWTLPTAPPSVKVHAEEASAIENTIDYFWVTDIARAVGVVVHRALARFESDGIESWSGPPASRHRHELAQLGVPFAELDRAASEVERALKNILSDTRGRWIFDPRHTERSSEYALTGIDDGELVSIVVDRTFVDGDGTRWIVDFKTGTHSGSKVEAFLDTEQTRYAPQLQRYARIMRKLDPRPIRLALYFPLLNGWREWAYQADHCDQRRGTQLDLQFD